MDPKAPDPNNHVPEVSPEDDWGDLDLTEDGVRTSAKGLPKRRNDELRRPKLLAPKDEVEVVRMVPDFDEDEEPPVIQRLEVEGERAKRKRKAVVVGEDGEEGPRKIEPSGQVSHLPAERVVKTEDEEWGAKANHSIRWMVYCGLGLVVLIIGGLSVRQIFVRSSKEVRKPAFVAAAAAEKEDFSFDAAAFDMGGDTQIEAEAMVVRYAAAKSVEEVLPMLRDRERVEEAVRKAWKPFWTEGEWKLPPTSEWTLRKVEERDFACLSGPMPDYTPFQIYFLRENGELLIDWEATTGYCETPVEELLQGKGGGVARLAISVSDMYTFALPDEQFQSLRMVAADRESVLWGYVKRGSEVENGLKPLFQPGLITREMGYEYRVTVRLAPSPEDSLPNQWIVAEMLHIDWLTP